MTSSNDMADHDDYIDLISDLPSNVIDGILQYLNIVDAVKTSTLSRKWRNMWLSVPQLLFEAQFFNNCNKNYKDLEISSIISEILMLHNGPVYKFILHIPFKYTIRIESLCNWILFLSRSGIKHLELGDQGYNFYEIPSHVFSCQELTYFILRQFVLSVPSSFCGFKSLLVINLYRITFLSGALESLISGCPLLEELTILFCSGFESVDGFAPTLKVLRIDSYRVIKSICLKEAKNLIDLTLMAYRSEDNVDIGSVTDLIEDLPKIERLIMGEGYTKVLSTCTIPSTIQESFSSLKYLRWNIVNFNERGEILFIVSLLKSAPNLVELVIKNYSSDVEQAPQRFNELESKSCCLNQLRTVTIKSETAYKSALDLIQFILASSPSLETLTFKIRLGNYRTGDPKLCKVSRELSLMERASRRAEVKFLTE